MECSGKENMSNGEKDERAVKRVKNTKRKMVDSAVCRRLTLLKRVGGSIMPSPDSLCCDVCSNGKVPDNVLVPWSVPRRKRSVAIRDVNEKMRKKLKEELLAERERILSEDPAYRMIGPNFVICDEVIDQLVDKANYILSVGDLRRLSLLCPEYHNQLFNVISSTISSAPTPLAKRRKRN